jgi:hypothetical protein
MSKKVIRNEIPLIEIASKESARVLNEFRKLIVSDDLYKRDCVK